MTQPKPSHQPERPLHSSSDMTGHIVVCTICQATYTPAPSHAYLLQAPPIALESAFMSMCHFCFRCRRPACPNCWDDIHGVCGSCDAEAHLPFRSAAAPFSGVLFPPSPPTPQTSVHPAPPPLVCISPGHYQAIATQSDIPTTPAYQPATESSPRERQIQSDFLQQRREQKIPQSTHQPIPSPSQADISELATQPGRRQHRVRSVLTVISTLLLAIVLLIALIIGAALVSGEVNALIVDMLHVDIRAEIAYLLQLIKHLL